MPRFQCDIGFDQLTRCLVRHTDHCDLGHSGVFHQRAFNLKRANQVTRTFDQIVAAPHKPEIPIRVAHRQIAAEIPAIVETFVIPRLLMQIAAHHRGPAGAQCKLAHREGVREFPHTVLGDVHNPGLDPRQGLAHGAGFDIHTRKVRDHYTARFSLPPIVVKRHAKGCVAPCHGFGVQRFADAGHEPQSAEIARPDGICPGFHQHSDGGGRGVPHVDRFAFQRVIPARHIKFRLIDNHRHAVGQRRDDPVGCARHPAGVGCAPVDIARLEIERHLPGHMMRHNSLVHMNHPLGFARRARREMQKSRVLDIHRRDVKTVRCSRHGGGKCGCFRVLAVDQKDLSEFRQPRAQRLEFAFVQPRRGDHGVCPADLHPGMDRFRSKRREERAEYGTGFERSECCNVEFGDPAQQRIDPVAPPDPSCFQNIRKPVGALLQVGVGKVRARACLGYPTQGNLCPVARIHVPVDGLEGHVQVAVRQPGDLVLRAAPLEAGIGGIVVDHIGRIDHLRALLNFLRLHHSASGIR